MKKSDMAIAAGLLVPFLSSKRFGSSSLTYDFRYLPESQFEDRRIKRYKKKFPRYRIIPKFAPESEIYVFYAPQIPLEAETFPISALDTGMERTEWILKFPEADDYWYAQNLAKVFARYPTISKEIKKLDLHNHPNRKVLIMGK